MWHAGALLGLCAAAYEAVLVRYRRRYGRNPKLQPPMWDRAAREALGAIANGGGVAAAGGSLKADIAMSARAADANAATSGSELDGDSATDAVPPPPPSSSTELSVNASPGQAARAALTRTQSEAELVRGAAAAELNPDLEYSGRADDLPKCLEELATVLPEFKDCGSNASSSTSAFSLKLGLKKSNSGKEASMDDSARLKHACKEVEALLKVVGSTCGEAVRVLEPVAIGSGYHSHGSSDGSGSSSHASRLHALVKIPPSPAAVAFLAEVCLCTFFVLLMFFLLSRDHACTRILCVSAKCIHFTSKSVYCTPSFLSIPFLHRWMQ